MIDDADDTRVNRRLGGIEREAGFLPAHEKHFLADARADGVHRDDRAAGRLALGCERLDDEQLDADEVLVLPRHHDIADDARELHYSLISTSSTMPTMEASTGQSFRPAAMRAELPLTTSTVSPTPASTVSMATRWLPSALPRGSIGRTISSLLLTSRGSLRVATTVPTILANSMKGSRFRVQGFRVRS